MDRRSPIPSFIFRINELREGPQSVPDTDGNGYWKPSLTPGYNNIVQQGVTNLWWLCNGQSIQICSDNRFLAGMVHYKTFSMFYSDGTGFWVLRGNATDPQSQHDEPWLPLCFEHDDSDGYSSFLTNARFQPALRCRRADQTWVRMLLPDVQHGSVVVQSQLQGALKGELAILLGLLAFSMPSESLQQYLPSMFSNGEFRQYEMQHGRIDKRGVVVEVYACPMPHGRTTAPALENLENGKNGLKYYY